MRLEELRKGNLIDTPYGVKRVIGFDALTEKIKFDDGYVLPFTICGPVDLTGAQLDVWGFKNDNIGYYTREMPNCFPHFEYCHVRGMVESYLAWPDLYEEEKEYIERCRVNFGGYGQKVIPYVHEFQNFWFILTREELL